MNNYREKGLDNKFGENNCFLNVVIQALWHLESFRAKFIAWENHDHQAENHCVFCALKIIFTQYSFSEIPSLPPSPLRNTLHELFCRELKFQRFSIDDAAEAFEAVLGCLRTAVKEGEKDIAKQVFEVESKKNFTCKGCSTPSVEEKNAQFIEYTYVSILREYKTRFPTMGIEKLIYLVSLERRGCPKDVNPCKEKDIVKRTIQNLPEVLSLGLVWDTPDPSVQQIQSTFSLFPSEIDMGAVFQNNEYAPADLRGMICYWGKHYNSYFYSKVYNQWLVFDDSTVRRVGTLDDVKNRCLLGHFHPSVIFYERRPGSYVPKEFIAKTSTIPVSIIPRKTPTAKVHQVGRRDKPTLNLFSTPQNNNDALLSPPTSPLRIDNANLNTTNPNNNNFNLNIGNNNITANNNNNIHYHNPNLMNINIPSSSSGGLNNEARNNNNVNINNNNNVTNNIYINHPITTPPRNVVPSPSPSPSPSQSPVPSHYQIPKQPPTQYLCPVPNPTALPPHIRVVQLVPVVRNLPKK